MVQMMSSSKGILALLREKDNAILLFALRRLMELMDTFWCEVAADLPLIEELYESTSLTLETRKLAALVASQVYFHLGAYDESVHFALAAGNAFDGSMRSLFTDTILSRCIDQYVARQERPEELREPVDPRLEDLFVSLTKSWILKDESEEIRELVGFTIRARRLDFLETVLKQYLTRTQSADILNYTFHVSNVLLRDITFRRKILHLLASLYTEGSAAVDYFAMAQCLLFLGDVPATASLIQGLLTSDNTMMAYQLAFDLFEYGNQEFLSALVKQLGATAAEGDNAECDEQGSSALTTSSRAEEKLLAVLSGEVTTKLHLKFLYARCAADIHVLNRMKKKIDPKRSVVHNATVMANAFIYAGTTIDGFLRDNMTWMGKADYWSKFTATASVGVVHRGHTEEAMRLLDPYLPKRDLPVLPYQEAGALYALGLIVSPLGMARDRVTIDYIAENLRMYSSSQQMVHGASLGLGLAAMGLQDEELFDALLNCVTGSDAVGGEGAAVGVGLLMMASGNQAVLESLKNIATEESQLEKVIRGAVMAMALVNLGRENEAQELANELLDSADPWVRLGGCFVVGLAYAGTENTTAIERLLHVTVKDTSDDVRRNAAMMVGFLTFKDPSLCLDLTKVLVDSYNSHIRYGVALALGISAAGTGREDIIEVLWDMRDDLVDLVRQGVYIALALVMVQLTEKEVPRVKEFRQMLDTRIGDRRESLSSKVGCILASGLLDAGGRNCTFALHRDRHRLNKAVVGLFMFSQYWYWYPYALMVSLAMQPTCIIALNDKLEMPEYTFMSNAPPSQFAVPKSVLQEKKETKAAGMKAVVLSTTRKEEEIRQRRGKPAADDETKDKAAGDAAGQEKKEEEPEPTTELLHSPARVTARQYKLISHTVDERYVPLKSNPLGVCLLRDTKPELGMQKLIDPIDVLGGDAAPPPEPFSYP